MRQENFGRKEKKNKKTKKTTTAVYQGMYLNEGEKNREIAPRDGFPLWAEEFQSCIWQ